jgi:hypothetical protein
LFLFIAFHRQSKEVCTKCDMISEFIYLLFRNEQLLKQGLEINDRLQNIISKYDIMASSTHLAVEAPPADNVEAPKEDPAEKPSAPPISTLEEEEEEEDEFTRLAQRYL